MIPSPTATGSGNRAQSFSSFDPAAALSGAGLRSSFVLVACIPSPAGVTAISPYAYLTAAWPRYWTVFDLATNGIAYLPLRVLAHADPAPHARPVDAGSGAAAPWGRAQLLP